MKVIGAGFGRTGTKSLQVALERLGFGPCHHMSELFSMPERAPLWLAAEAGKDVDWDEILAGFNSIVDWPGARFYEQLAARYPGAKVVLTVRDPNRWYQSCLNTIYPASAPESTSELVTSGNPVAAVIDAVIWKGTFGSAFLDRQQAISIFERHNREARERIPSDRLLVYEVSQGWGPLCHFLGVQVPADVPFPRQNTTEEWQQARSESELPVTRD